MTTLYKVNGDTLVGTPATMADGTPFYAPVVSLVDSTGVTIGGTAVPFAMQGNVASGATDSGNPVKTAGVFLTTQPTVTTGQRVDTQATSRGETLVAISNGAAQVAVTQAASDGTSIATNRLLVLSLGQVWNGATTDRLRKPNAYKRVASSAASGNPDFAKNAAGDLMAFWGVNTQAALRYLHIYNKASAPTLGTDTPIMSFPIPASAQFSVTIPNGGAYCSTGIAFAFTTDIVTIPTTGAAAGDITAFALLVA